MHVVYIDDSGNRDIAIFCALTFDAATWHANSALLATLRAQMRAKYKIPSRMELRGTDFLAGRGRLQGIPLHRFDRARIFKGILKVVAGWNGVRLLASVFPRAQNDRAFERLFNRIDRTMAAWRSQAIVVCDRGKELRYTRLARRMRVHNFISSDRGVWADTGTQTKNIPTERIIEDPWFRNSEDSPFVQLADFAAHALFRREVPTERGAGYGLHRAFDPLIPIIVREACRKDPEGIIRP